MIDKFFQLSSYYFNPYVLPFALTSVIILVLGYYGYKQNNQSLTNRAFFVFCVFLAISYVAMTLGLSTEDEYISVIWGEYLAFPMFAVLAAMYQFFVFNYLKNYSKWKKVNTVAFAAVAVVILLELFTDLVTVDVSRAFFGNVFIFDGLALKPFLPIYYVTHLFTLFILGKSIRRESNPKIKKRYKLLFISTIFGYLSAVDILPALGIHIYSFGFVFILINVAIVYFTISRHRLLIMGLPTTSRLIVALIADAVITVDDDGEIQYANKAALKMLRYKETELIDRDYRQIIGNKDVLKNKILLKRDVVTNLSAYLITKDGNRIASNLSITAIKSGSNILAGYVIVAKDMRQINSMVKQIKKQTHQLKKNSKELSSQIKSLEEMNQNMIDREEKIIELKEKIKILEENQ